MEPKTKEKIYIGIIILLIALCGQFYYSFHYQPQAEIQVYYNHDQKLNEEIINIIRDSDKFVYFGIYTFTRQDIQDALLAAKHRGITVIGITDRDQVVKIESQKKIIEKLRAKDIPIYEQDHEGIMHVKIVVTEKAYASGSFNWTTSATNINDEVLEVGKSEQIRSKYEKILKELFSRYKK